MYAFWYLLHRIAFYLRRPYIRGTRWRYWFYLIRSYPLRVLPLDLAIGRQLAIRYLQRVF